MRSYTLAVYVLVRLPTLDLPYSTRITTTASRSSSSGRPFSADVTPFCRGSDRCYHDHGGYYGYIFSFSHHVVKSTQTSADPNDGISTHVSENDEPQPQQARDTTVTILDHGPAYVVASKPPSVVCHHSGWTGSRSGSKAKKRGGEEPPEIPMLQRVRDGISSNSTFAEGKRKRRVNLVHRLDRGASGCLLFAYADDDDDENDGEEDSSRDEVIISSDDDSDNTWSKRSNGSSRRRSSTAILQAALASPNATKTYIALVRGEGILRGEDLRARGWFKVDRPIKDERGRLNNATTLFRFVAGQPYDEDNDMPRASLVLARPETGRWHQVRRHLNGLSHPILGDTSHGSSQTNREWKERRNMPGERTCLHLARLEIPPNDAAPAIRKSSQKSR